MPSPPKGTGGAPDETSPAHSDGRRDDKEERSVAVEIAAESSGEISDMSKRIEALREEVTVQGGVALRTDGAGHYGARFHVAAGDPATAVEEGVTALRRAAAAAGVPDGKVVDVEAPTLAEMGGPDTAEIPDLVDMAGLTEILGVNRQLATIVARSKGFPRPAAELNGGPIWTRSEVDRFLRREGARLTHE